MKHIFIIEDDSGILDGLTFLLADNYQITPIMDAREALEKLSSERPNLILVDLLMPHLNGRDFIKQLSERQIDIPILVMTASSSVETQLKGLKVAGIIQKPFGIEEIESRISQLLAS